MYNLPEITQSADKLKKLVRKEQDAQIQRRYHMLLLLKTGEAESRSGAARHLGVHRNTIASWLELYEDGGLEGIQKVGEPGPDPGQQSIPLEVMENLKKRLSESTGGDGEAQRASLQAGGIWKLQRDPAVACRRART